jgi:hypothetical protein
MTKSNTTLGVIRRCKIQFCRLVAQNGFLSVSRAASFIALVSFLIVSAFAQPANAWIRPSSTQQTFLDFGTCRAHAEIRHNSDTATFSFLQKTGAGQSSTPGGTYWLNGSVTTSSHTATTAAILDATCGISDVTLYSSDGASGTYATETIMGAVFRATADADGLVYEYVFTISGAAGAAPVITLTVTLVVTNPQDTSDDIADFLQQRAAMILGALPDFGRFLDDEPGLATRSLMFDAGNGAANLSFSGSFSSRGNSGFLGDGSESWGQMRGVYSQAGTSNANLFVGALGAHRHISDGLLVGGMIQIDLGGKTDATAGSSGSGNGFLLGP